MKYSQKSKAQLPPRLLKKGILDEFQSDFLCLPWNARKELLESIRDLYEGETEYTLDWYQLYRTLFYFVYDSQFDPNTNPTVKLFKMFNVYRENWTGLDIID